MLPDTSLLKLGHTFFYNVLIILDVKTWTPIFRLHIHKRVGAPIPPAFTGISAGRGICGNGVAPGSILHPNSGEIVDE